MALIFLRSPLESIRRFTEGSDEEDTRKCVDAPDIWAFKTMGDLMVLEIHDCTKAWFSSSDSPNTGCIVL